MYVAFTHISVDVPVLRIDPAGMQLSTELCGYLSSTSLPISFVAIFHPYRKRELLAETFLFLYREFYYELHCRKLNALSNLHLQLYLIDIFNYPAFDLIFLYKNVMWSFICSCMKFALTFHENYLASYNMSNMTRYLYSLHISMLVFPDIAQMSNSLDLCN